MSDYLSCMAFKNKFVLSTNFEISQEEIIKRNKLQFEKVDVTYNCVWKPTDDIKIDQPFVIVPIKNNYKLLEYTLTNFKNHNFFDHVNIILVDDRSSENIEAACEGYNISYLRIDNSKGFNFSMLNNIAALVSYNLGAKEIILWNSDLKIQ